jgi:hypothetical protein
MSDGRILNAPLEGLSKTKDDGVRGEVPMQQRWSTRRWVCCVVSQTLWLTRLRSQEKRWKGGPTLVGGSGMLRHDCCGMSEGEIPSSRFGMHNSARPNYSTNSSVFLIVKSRPLQLWMAIHCYCLILLLDSCVDLCSDSFNWSGLLGLWHTTLVNISVWCLHPQRYSRLISADRRCLHQPKSILKTKLL